ncbi:hypothetical protein PFISCL1PPCAC_11558, partial [Pristionchus fissidentatus]
VDGVGKLGFKIITPLIGRGNKIFRGDHDLFNDLDNGYQYHPDHAQANRPKVVVLRMPDHPHRHKKKSRGGERSDMKESDDDDEENE